MEMLRDHQDVNSRFFFLGYNSDKLSRIQIIFHDLRSVNRMEVFRNETCLFNVHSWVWDVDHVSCLLYVNECFLFVRYILISKPAVWTAELRVQFLEGFKVFLRLLRCMQVTLTSAATHPMAASESRTFTLVMITWRLLIHCFQFPFFKGMEEVKRQFGQHIAVEPEWEAGFSLQIQLRHILPMFQDWCSSEVSVKFTPSKTFPSELGCVWRQEGNIKWIISSRCVLPLGWDPAAGI